MSHLLRRLTSASASKRPLVSQTVEGQTLEGQTLEGQTLENLTSQRVTLMSPTRLRPGLLACGWMVGMALLTACSGDVPDDDTTPSPSVTPVPPTPTPTACPDADSDGSCDAADCDDVNASIYPGALETPYDAIDQDCNGTDLIDVDGDLVPGGLTGTDCNDTDASVSPNALEDCNNGLDNNCDGAVDNLPACSNQDYDLDGLTEDQGDCDDEDANLYPGNVESFDGKDNNCDGVEGRLMALKPGVDITVSGDVSNQQVGKSVAGLPSRTYFSVNGDALADLVIGAPGFGGQGRGGVALYFGVTSWTYAPNFSASGLLYTESQPDAQAGTAVGSLGDLNYDGLIDFAVGNPFYNSTTATDSGRGHVFLGQTANWLTGDLENRDSSAIPGYFKDIYMGTGIDGGDVTGDGKDDMLIGARTNLDGWVFILPGEGSIPPSIQLDDISKVQAKDGRLLGTSVAFVGDTNSDGIGDFISGGAYSSGNEGYLLWVPGSTNFRANSWYDIENTSVSSDPLEKYIEFTGATTQEGAGWSVSGNGDINGDGAMDFAAGDSGTRDLSDPGVFLFFGGARFLGGSVPAKATLPIKDSANVKVMLSQYDACPCSVALQGDMNADGYADLLIGTANSKKDGNSQASGRVYLFLGRPNWPSTLTLDLDADYILDGASQGEQAGYAVSWLGDFNGDGRADFAIGAPGADVSVNGTNAVDAGRAYVMLGIDAPTP